MPNTPGTVDYPTALDTVVTLFQAKNQATTTLAASMGVGDTSCTVVSTAPFAANGVIVIDNEIIFYTGVTATTFTGLIRGREGTVAAAHASGADVRQRFTARQRDVIADAIIAVEAELGIAPSSTFATLTERLSDGTFKPSLHTHLSGSDEGPLSHGDLDDVNPNDHHPQEHSHAEHTGLLPVAQLPLLTPSGVVKIADETVNNSAVLQNDDHLKFPMVVGASYAVDLELIIQSVSGPSTSGFQVGWGVPAGATGHWGVLSRLTGNQTWLNVGGVAQAPDLLHGSFAETQNFGSANGIYGLLLRAHVDNPANAGDFQFKWAQVAAVAENTKLLKGSLMRYTRKT